MPTPSRLWFRRGPVATAIIGQGVCRLSSDEFDSSSPEPPRLKNALTRLDCTARERIVMGDHLTIVGEVERFETRPGDALTYYRGRYGTAAEPQT